MKWTKRKTFSMLWVIAGISFTIWLWLAYGAKGVAKEVLQSDKLMKVEDTDDYIKFTPAGQYRNVFIFYPGAMVAPVAYAPLCRKIADKNALVFLIKMPWRLASKGYNKPKELSLFTDSTKQYILAGHSQGAKMAAQFVYENPGLVDKLILMGTTHPRDIDLSKVPIPVMKISGSKDGVAGIEDINRNKSKLPATTRYVVIDGANHSQFGYYGYQLGDDKATISREFQQQKVLENILDFIK